MVRARFLVRGRVQGVWFRGATQERARGYRVVGWVRNCADGSVEGEAQGPRAAVDALLAWCRTGPPAARVDDVAVEWIAPADPPEPDFTVRR